MEHEPSPAPEDVPPEGVHCTLRLIRKKDGSEISRYPVDGEVTSFGRDESNDVRLYYNDISRFHCTLHSTPDESHATLRVTGTNGVEVNGQLVKPPGEVILKRGDMFEMRKKRFVISFPHAPAGAQGSGPASPARPATPRRKRPSQRMSLMPNDLPQSPYAGSPLRKISDHRSSASTPIRPATASADAPGSAEALGTPVRGQPETAGSTPFKTPRSVPLPAASETPYSAGPSTIPLTAPPADTSNAPPTIVLPPAPQPTPSSKPARKVGRHGPSSLRKSILVRSAWKAGAGEAEQESTSSEEVGQEVELEAGGEEDEEEKEEDEEMLGAEKQRTEQDPQEELQNEEEDREVSSREAEEDRPETVNDVRADQGELDEDPFFDGAYEPISGELRQEESEEPLEDGKAELVASMDEMTDEAPLQDEGEEAEISLDEEVKLAPADEEEEEPPIDEHSGELAEAVASVEEIGSPSPRPAAALPGTPQMSRPLSNRFYTPQATSSSSNAPRPSALLRTMGPPVRVAPPAGRASPSAFSRMGPPVRVPVSERKAGPAVGAVGRFVKAEGGGQRRSSMGSPIRMPKQPVPEREEEQQPSPRRQTPSAAERAARLGSTASILASAPRALPRLSTLDLAGLSSPRKTPAAAALPLTLPDLAGSSSDDDDEKSTPLRALAKKAERLKRKSIGARSSIGGGDVPRRASSLFPTPFAAGSATTPVRSRLAQVTTGTPTSSSTQGTPLASTSAPAQAGEEPPTPDMGAIKHLFKKPIQTPLYGGVRQLLRTPAQPPPAVDPSFTGVGALFASPRTAESAAAPPASPAAGRVADAEPSQELDAASEVAPVGSPSPAGAPRPTRRSRSTPSESPAPPSATAAAPSAEAKGFSSTVAVDDGDELVMEVDPMLAWPASREPSSSPAPVAKPTTSRTRGVVPPAKKATPGASSRKRKTATPSPAPADDEPEAAAEAEAVEEEEDEDEAEPAPPPKAASRSRAAAATKLKAPAAPKPRATRKAATHAATPPPAESSLSNRRSPSVDEDEDSEDNVIAVASPEAKRPTARSRAAAATTAATTAAAKKPAATRKTAAAPSAASKKAVASRTHKATMPIDEDEDEDMGEKNSVPVPKTTRARATTSKAAAVTAAVVPKARAPRKAAAAVKEEVPDEAPARATRATRSRK